MKSVIILYLLTIAFAFDYDTFTFKTTSNTYSLYLHTDDYETVYEKFKEKDFLFPVYKKGIFISNLESTLDTLKETDHTGAIEVYIKQGSNTIKTQIFCYIGNVDIPKYNHGYYLSCLGYRSYDEIKLTGAKVPADLQSYERALDYNYIYFEDYQNIEIFDTLPLNLNIQGGSNDDDDDDDDEDSGEIINGKLIVFLLTFLIFA